MPEVQATRSCPTVEPEAKRKYCSSQNYKTGRTFPVEPYGISNEEILVAIVRAELEL